MLLEVYNPNGRVPSQMFEVLPDKAKMLVIQKGWTMEKPPGLAVPPPSVVVLPVVPKSVPVVAPPAPASAPIPPPVPPAPPAPPAPPPPAPAPVAETALEKAGHETNTPIPEPAGLADPKTL
jgi:hypothetical protein